MTETEEIVTDVDLEAIMLTKQNPNNYRILFDKYYWRIYHFVRNKIVFNDRGGTLKRVEDTHDLCMISFERIFESIIHDNLNTNFKTGIYTVAKQSILRYFEQYKYLTSIADEYEEDSQTRCIVPSHYPSPEVLVEREDFLNNFKMIIRCMPEIYYQPALLYFVEDYDQQHISQMLKLPQSTIEGRIAYAREFLAKRINKYNLKVKRQVKLEFSSQELEFIQSNFHKLTMAQLHHEICKMRDVAIHIGTLRKFCNQTLKLMRGKETGLNRKYEFSEMELNYIKSNYGKISYYQMAQNLNAHRTTEINHRAIETFIKKLKKNETIN